MLICYHGYLTLGEIIKAIIWDLPKEIIKKPFRKKKNNKQDNH